mmetsp:Transcript_12815/g.12727  ORF Transcript_12815/g.12727 Transcript_12815/m.12727 type:complete len:109 (-) Transcript_12815:446-772(-)
MADDVLTAVYLIDGLLLVLLVHLVVVLDRTVQLLKHFINLVLQEILTRFIDLFFCFLLLQDLALTCLDLVHAFLALSRALLSRVQNRLQVRVLPFVCLFLPATSRLLT